MAYSYEIIINPPGSKIWLRHYLYLRVPNSIAHMHYNVDSFSVIDLLLNPHRCGHEFPLQMLAMLSFDCRGRLCTSLNRDTPVHRCNSHRLPRARIPASQQDLSLNPGIYSRDQGALYTMSDAKWSERLSSWIHGPMAVVWAFRSAEVSRESASPTSLHCVARRN